MADLEGHELVVGPRGPGVDLDAVAQGDDEEFDLLVFDDLEVHRALQVAHVDPPVALLQLQQSKTKKNSVRSTFLFAGRCLGEEEIDANMKKKTKRNVPDRRRPRCAGSWT